MGQLAITSNRQTNSCCRSEEIRLQAYQYTSPAQQQSLTISEQAKATVPSGRWYYPTPGAGGDLHSNTMGGCLPKPSLPPRAQGEAALRTCQSHSGCRAAASALSPGSREAARAHAAQRAPAAASAEADGPTLLVTVQHTDTRERSPR